MEAQFLSLSSLNLEYGELMIFSSKYIHYTSQLGHFHVDDSLL